MRAFIHMNTPSIIDILEALGYTKAPTYETQEEYLIVDTHSALIFSRGIEAMDLSTSIFINAVCFGKDILNFLHFVVKNAGK